MKPWEMFGQQEEPPMEKKPWEMFSSEQAEKTGPWDDFKEQQPTPRPVKFMDWNLQKALRNQGVDPATMKVVDPSRDWGFFKKLVRSFKSGDAEMRMDWRMNEAAVSETDIYAKFKADEDTYRKAKALNPIEADNWFEQAFFGAANSAAGMAYSMGGKVAGSAVGLGLATAAAALTPGPVDEAVIGGMFVSKLLGKSALAKAGSLVGGAAPYYLQGRGSLYRDMREMGVDHQTAQNAATIGAAPYAAIEFINDYIPGQSLVRRFAPGLTKAAKPIVSKSISEAVLRTMAKWGVSTMAEASEEFWQEISNEVTKNVAASIDTNEESKASPMSEVFKRGVAAMVQAVGPSMVLGGASTAYFGLRQAKMSGAYNALHDMGIDKDTAKYMVATFTGSELSQVKNLKTNDENEFMEAVVDLAKTRIGEHGVKEIMLDNPDMSEDTLLHILASPAPRAAYLAWQHEGDAGVKKINDQQSLQSVQNQAMLALVDDKEIPPADKVKILTAPNMYKSLQNYMTKQKEVSADEEVSKETVAEEVSETAGEESRQAKEEVIMATADAAAPAAGPAVAETNIRKTAVDRYSEILSSDVRGGSIGDVRDVLDGEALRVANKYLPPDARIEVRVGTVPEGETAYMQPKTSVRGPRIIISNDPEMLMRETDQQDIGSAIAQVVIHEIGHAANDIAGKDWMSEADSSKMEAEIASILRKPAAPPAAPAAPAVEGEAAAKKQPDAVTTAERKPTSQMSGTELVALSPKQQVDAANEIVVKPLAQRTPAEDNFLAAFTGAGASTGAITDHIPAINSALRKNLPVSAAAVDNYRIKLPEGYTREGDLYVFKGDVPAPKDAEPALTAKQSSPTVKESRTVAEPKEGDAKSPELMTPEELRAEGYIPVWRGTDERGFGEISRTEGGAQGSGVDFYTDPLPARSHATGNGGVIAGWIPASKARITGLDKNVAHIDNATDFIPRGRVVEGDTYERDSYIAKANAATSEPTGYVREGDRYVFKGAAPAPKDVAPAPAPTPTAPVKTLLKPGEKPNSAKDLFIRDKVLYKGKEYVVSKKEPGNNNQVSIISAIDPSESEDQYVNVSELTLVERNVQTVVTEELKNAFEKLREQYPNAADNAQKLLDSVNVVPAIVGKVNAKELKQAAAILDGGINPANVVDNVEGAITGLDNEQRLILLGKLASPFAVAHEMHHALFDVLNSVPRYHQAIMNYFDSLFHSGSEAFSNWRITDAGKKFIKNNKKDFDAGIINIEMREMLARTMEISLSREGIEFDNLGRKRHTGRRSFLHNEIFDSLPEPIKNFIREIAELFALMWRDLNNMRSEWKASEYKIPFPSHKDFALSNLNQLLLSYSRLEGLNEEMLSDIREQIAPRMAELREQLIASYTALYQAGKLPQVAKALLERPSNNGFLTYYRKLSGNYAENPEGYIRWMADASVSVMERMAINTALLQTKEQQTAVLGKMVESVVDNAMVNAPYVSRNGIRSTEKGNKPFLVNIVDLIQSHIMRSNYGSQAAKDKLLEVVQNIEGDIRNLSVPHYAKIVADAWWKIHGADTSKSNVEEFTSFVLNAMTLKLVPSESLARLAHFDGLRFSAELKHHPKDLKPYAVVGIILERHRRPEVNVGDVSIVESTKGAKDQKRQSVKSDKLITDTDVNLAKELSKNPAKLINAYLDDDPQALESLKQVIENPAINEIFVNAFADQMRNYDAQLRLKLYEAWKKLNRDIESGVMASRSEEPSTMLSAANAKMKDNKIESEAHQELLLDTWKDLISRKTITTRHVVETMPNLIKKGRESIKGKTNREVLDSVRSSTSSPHERLAVLMALGMRGSASSKTVKVINDIFSAITSITSEAGLTMRLAKEMFTDASHPGRMMLLEHMIGKMNEEEAKKAALKFAKQAQKRMPKKEKEFADSEGESGIGNMVDESIGKDGLSPRAKGDTFEAGFRNGILTNAIIDAVNSIHSQYDSARKRKPGVLFSSSTEDKNVEGDDLLMFAGNVLLDLAMKDSAVLSKANEEATTQQIVAAVKKTHKAQWESASTDEQQLFRKKIWELILKVRSKVAIVSQQLLAGTGEPEAALEEISDVGAQGTEEGKLVSKFVSMIEQYAKDMPDEITPMKDKATALAIVRALMNRVKEDVLVEAGKQKATVKSDFHAVERLSKIAENVELAQQIWAEAQTIVDGMENLAPKAQEFLRAMLSNPFARKEVARSLELFLEHGDEKSFPAAFKNANGNFSHRLSNIRDYVTRTMMENAGEPPTDTQIEDAVEETAIAFADEMLANTNVDKNVIDSLVETAKDVLRDQVRDKMQYEFDVQKEAVRLGNSIIKRIAGSNIRPDSAEGLAAKNLIRAMQVAGIIEKIDKDSSASVFRQLRLQVEAAPINRQIIAETISQLEATLVAASEVDAPQFLVNMRGEIAGLIAQMENSRALRKWMNDGLLKSTVDKAINTILSMYGKNGEPIQITMRKMIYANYHNMRFAAQKIAEQIAVQTGLPESMVHTIVKNVESRFIERFMKARQHELQSIMGRDSVPWKPSEDKLERILVRIHLGATDTPEMAKRLADYMGLNGMDSATREHFRKLSQAIEDRGLQVNRNDPGVITGGPGDYWHNSAERRAMLRNFYKEMNKAKGYSGWDKFATWYFAALLSGMSTQEVNFVSTGLQAVAHTMAKAFATHIIGNNNRQWLHDWRGFFGTIGEFFKGFASSITSDVPIIVRTGNVYGPRISEMASIKHVMLAEQDVYPGKIGKIALGIMRIPARGLQAMDTIMANAAYSAHQAMIARTEAVELGLTGSDLEIAEKVILASRLHRSSFFDVTTKDGVNNLLKELQKLDGKITAEHYADLQLRVANTGAYAEQAFYEIKGDVAFTQKAVNEMSRDDRVKYYKRIDELQFEALPESEKDQLVRNAGEATFNFSEHDLYDQTFIGKITKSILEMRRDVPGLQFILPFVRIVGRVMDLSLDYTPIGLWRAGTVRKLMVDETSGNKFTKADVDTLKTKALFGTLTTLAVFTNAVVSMLRDDDDDDWFQLTAKGPSDRNKANILREGRGYGFQESSIRIGKTWISYKYTPLVIPFTLFGSMLDVLRYDIGARKYRNASPQEKELLEATFKHKVFKGFAYGIARSIPAMFEQSYMNSLSDFMEILSTPNEDVRRDKMTRLIARMTTGFVVPNFVKQINRSFDPSLYTVPEQMNELAGQMLRELPMPAAWKGNMLLRRYNVLGEPIRLTSPSIFSSLLEIVLRNKENRPTNIGRFISAGEQSDKTWTWLAKNDIRIAGVTASEQILGIPMTDEIRQDYIQKRGRVIRAVLESMQDKYDLDNIPPDMAQKIVSNIVPQISRTVKAAMITDPGLIRELARNRRAEIWSKYGILLPYQR